MNNFGLHALGFLKEASGLGADSKPFNCPPGLPFLYHSVKDCGWRAYLLILAWIEMGVLNILVALNLLGCIFLPFSIDSGIGWTAAAIVYAIFIPFCVTFFVLYWSLYKAALTNNIIRYVVAIAIWGIAFFWNLVMAAGVPGGAGFFPAISLSVKAAREQKLSGFNVFVLIYCYIMSALFIINALFVLLIMGLLCFHLIKEGQKPALEAAAERASEGMDQVSQIKDTMTTTFVTEAMSLGI